jgi:hypothetical protein
MNRAIDPRLNFARIPVPHVQGYGVAAATVAIVTTARDKTERKSMNWYSVWRQKL